MKSQKVVPKVENAAQSKSRTDTTKEQTTEYVPTPEEIRKRAFEIHLGRGAIHGCDLDDWLQAERELREKHTNTRREAAKA